MWQSATVSLSSAVADTALPGYTVFEQLKSQLHGAIQSMNETPSIVASEQVATELLERDHCLCLSRHLPL